MPPSSARWRKDFRGGSPSISLNRRLNSSSASRAVPRKCGQGGNTRVASSSRTRSSEDAAAERACAAFRAAFTVSDPSESPGKQSERARNRAECPRLRS